MNLTQLFCDVDDFCNVFIQEWEKTQISDGKKKRQRKRCLTPSLDSTNKCNFFIAINQ